MKPRIYTDFMMHDGDGRVIVFMNGKDHPSKMPIPFRNGLEVILYSDDSDDDGKSDDLEVDAVLEYNEAHRYWVGIYDKTKFRHVSDCRRGK